MSEWRNSPGQVRVSDGQLKTISPVANMNIAAPALLRRPHRPRRGLKSRMGPQGFRSLFRILDIGDYASRLSRAMLPTLSYASPANVGFVAITGRLVRAATVSISATSRHFSPAQEDSICPRIGR